MYLKYQYNFPPILPPHDDCTHLLLNSFAQIPNELSSFTSLEWLYVEVSNPLDYVPTFLSDLVKLRHLVFERTGISSIPPEICQLKLDQFEIVASLLTKIPTELSKISSLRCLILFDNQITLFPKELCYLSNLERLELSSNKIEKLPKELGNLVALQILLVDNNFLSKIPYSIRELANLSELSVFGNPLQRFPRIANLKPCMVCADHISNFANLDLSNIYEIYANTLPARFFSYSPPYLSLQGYDGLIEIACVTRQVEDPRRRCWNNLGTLL